MYIKAVANNPDKFPVGYVVVLTTKEKSELVENFHRFNKLKHSAVNPKAFPEKGLYMLATILKSPQAVKAVLAIIENFFQNQGSVPQYQNPFQVCGVCD